MSEMPQADKHEIARRGRELYESRIRSVVEPTENGKFLVVDVDSGEYEMDSDSLAAIDRLRERLAEPTLFLMQIGEETAMRIGVGVVMA